MKEEVKEFKTKEDFAKSFVPSLKQALKMAERKAAGEKLENDGDEWIKKLIEEAEEMKAGELKDAD